MRTDQYIGLNEWASNFVSGEDKLMWTDTIHRVYPDGTEETIGPRPVHGSNVAMENYESISGAFGNTFPLFKYTFDDGREFYEYIQAEPWSSGPCYFLALRDSKGDPVKESLWDEEEINNA